MYAAHLPLLSVTNNNNDSLTNNLSHIISGAHILSLYLRQCTFFRTLSEKCLVTLCAHAQRLVLRPGEAVPAQANEGLIVVWCGALLCPYGANDDKEDVHLLTAGFAAGHAAEPVGAPPSPAPVAQVSTECVVVPAAAARQARDLMKRWWFVPPRARAAAQTLPMSRVGDDAERVTQLAVDMAPELLQKVPAAGRVHIGRCIKYRRMNPHEMLFKQGDEGNAFYAVLSGTCEVRILQRRSSDHGGAARRPSRPSVTEPSVAPSVPPNANGVPSSGARQKKRGSVTRRMSSVPAATAARSTKGLAAEGTSLGNAAGDASEQDPAAKEGQDKRSKSVLRKMSTVAVSTKATDPAANCAGALSERRDSRRRSSGRLSISIDPIAIAERFASMHNEIQMSWAAKNESVYGTVVKVVLPGDSFGELALIDSSKCRLASITAGNGGAELLELMRIDYDVTLRAAQEEALQSQLSFLRAIGPMRMLRREDAVRVVCALKPITCGLWTVAAKRGAPALGMYLVQSGECRLLAPGNSDDCVDVEAAAIGPRDTFGEEALRRDRRGNPAPAEHKVTVVSARSRTELLMLPRRDALRLLGTLCRSMLAKHAASRLDRLGAREQQTKRARKQAVRAAAKHQALVKSPPRLRLSTSDKISDANLSASCPVPRLDLAQIHRVYGGDEKNGVGDTVITPRLSALRCRCRLLNDDDFVSFTARHARPVESGGVIATATDLALQRRRRHEASRRSSTSGANSAKIQATSRQRPIVLPPVTSHLNPSSCDRHGSSVLMTMVPKSLRGPAWRLLGDSPASSMANRETPRARAIERVELAEMMEVRRHEALADVRSWVVSLW